MSVHNRTSRDGALKKGDSGTTVLKATEVTIQKPQADSSLRVSFSTTGTVPTIVPETRQPRAFRAPMATNALDRGTERE
jgi:hypothetical protein